MRDESGKPGTVWVILGLDSNKGWHCTMEPCEGTHGFLPFLSCSNLPQHSFLSRCKGVNSVFVSQLKLSSLLGKCL
ncbi:hypothetical protein COLO4_29361 [Corchorus olitorius]|uniref:Uncharacterized protein n=1 Tax=Corchorus olitorius TaxID=93759 RepID=A0A1R3HF05_9ROSI|nr:hypothetical protein COLO4_29361 [Corchorus olitorius]